MYKIFALMLVLPLVLCGCYDSTETDALATVMAVGVDKSQTEGYKKYTFAVADSGSFAEPGKGEGSSLICFTSEGRDIDSAVYHMSEKISKELSFSHLSAIIFSKGPASEGMYDEIDYFERKISVRPQTMLALTDTESEKYLKGLKPVLESNPEKYFQSMFREGDTYVTSLDISGFIDAYHTERSCFMPYIVSKGDDISEKNSYVKSAFAVKDAKAKELVEEKWLMGLLKSTKKVKYKGTDVKSRKKPKILVDIQDGKLKTKVLLSVKADNNLNAGALEKDMENALSQYGKKGCDILDIALIARSEFALQKDYEKYNWTDLLNDAVFKVTVSTKEDKI